MYFSRFIVNFTFKYAKVLILKKNKFASSAKTNQLVGHPLHNNQLAVNATSYKYSALKIAW